MKKKHLAVMITSAIAAGVVIYYIRKNKTQTTTRLARVADEGYETAEDILFPLSHNRKRR